MLHFPEPQTIKEAFDLATQIDHRLYERRRQSQLNALCRVNPNSRCSVPQLDQPHNLHPVIPHSNSTLITQKTPVCIASQQLLLPTTNGQKLLLPATLQVGATSFTVTPLIDSGADNNFIDLSFVQQHSIPTVNLSSPIQILLADGSTQPQNVVTQQT